jgi:hypothetical protein
MVEFTLLEPVSLLFLCQDEETEAGSEVTQPVRCAGVKFESRMFDSKNNCPICWVFGTPKSCPNTTSSPPGVSSLWAAPVDVAKYTVASPG